MYVATCWIARAICWSLSFGNDMGNATAILPLDAAAAAKGYLLTPARFGVRGRIESELLAFQLQLEYLRARPPTDGEMRRAYSRLSWHVIHAAHAATSAIVGSGFSTGRIKSKLNGMTNPPRS